MINDHAPGRPIKVGVTEWNTTAGDWGPRRAMLWTLENALACARYQNVIHRHCDLVAIACRSNLTNSFCSGCIQTDNHRLYKTPVYYAQQLYATAGGRSAAEDRSRRYPPNSGPRLERDALARGDAVDPSGRERQPEAISRPLDFSAFATAGACRLKPSRYGHWATREMPASPTSPIASPSPSESCRARSTIHSPATSV